MRRHAAVRRIDNQRRSLFSIHDGVTSNPDRASRVVSAHIARGAQRSIAALGRRRTVAIDGLHRRVPVCRGACCLQLQRLLFREHQRRALRPLHRRERGQVVGALQVRMAIGHARRRVRLGLGLLGLSSRRRECQQSSAAIAGTPANATNRFRISVPPRLSGPAASCATGRTSTLPQTPRT